MRPFLVATLTLMLAACASPPTEVAAANPNAQSCHREVPTGSNVWHTVCVDPQVAADNQRAIDQVQDKVQHSPAVRAGTVQGGD
jgi:uncharacterized lipoprotein YajG